MERVISKIRKSTANEVWVVVTDFTGQLRLDLREYFHTPDGARPTKKGLSIPVSEIPALRDALEALARTTDLGTVAILHRSQRAEVQAGLRRFEGHTYAELRVFIPGSTPESAWKPTPKGLTLSPSLVPLLSEAVGEAEELAGSLDQSGHLRGFGQDP